VYFPTDLKTSTCCLFTEFVLIPISLHEHENVKLRFADLLGNHLSAFKELFCSLGNKI